MNLSASLQDLIVATSRRTPQGSMTKSASRMGEHTASWLRLTSVLLALSAPVAAQDQSQAGGLPALEARVTALEGMVNTLTTALAAETAARLAADAQLQSAINAEAAARQAADASLQSAINSEAAARQAADTSQQNAISNEIAARQGADASLQAAINTEAAARVAGDQQLSVQIDSDKPKYFVGTQLADFLPNGDDTVVARIEGLPTGTYLLSANLTVSNFEEDPYWDCTLYFLGQFPMHRVTTSTIGVGIIDTDSPVQSLSLQTPMTVTASDVPASVTLRCESEEPKSFVSNVKFFALRVGPL